MAKTKIILSTRAESCPVIRLLCAKFSAWSFWQTSLWYESPFVTGVFWSQAVCNIVIKTCEINGLCCKPFLQHWVVPTKHSHFCQKLLQQSKNRISNFTINLKVFLNRLNLAGTPWLQSTRQHDWSASGGVRGFPRWPLWRYESLLHTCKARHHSAEGPPGESNFTSGWLQLAPKPGD